jgi:hypothetical protein
MTSDPQKPEGLSAVYARSENLLPKVEQPNSPWSMVLGLGGVALLGMFAFTSLSHARTTREQGDPRQMAASSQAVPAWDPALRMMMAQNQATPPPQTMAPAPAPTTMPPAAQTPAPTDPAEPHWRAPAVVVDLSDSAGPAATRLSQAAGATAATPAEDARLNPEERFAARVSGSTAETSRATQMRGLSRTIPQGFVIPRGSKLIGQYRSAAAVGQTRAFVVWSRIITPAGVSIEVGSPATDPLGRGGLAGKADTHFFERFGASILLSVVSAGVDAAGRSGGNSTSLVIGSTGQANQVASIALQKQIDIPTTIRVPQGAPVQVSVARDLDFSGVAAER